MRSIYTGFAPYGGADTFFAGANTGRGFIGVYDTIADEGAREHVYIIKGASGTGKSTLMRKIAEEAETAGYPVRRYLCGSDPTSLDAVVLDERIVVLDGTAPHSRDMVYPGAASSRIDVSRFWKRDRLAENRAELVACGAEKKAAFAAGTRYLAAAEMAEEESHEAMARCVDREKLERGARARLSDAWDRDARAGLHHGTRGGGAIRDRGRTGCGNGAARGSRKRVSAARRGCVDRTPPDRRPDHLLIYSVAGPPL